MSIIDCIKRKFTHAIIPCCSERNCKLGLDGLSNYVILKGEKICQGRKICDCIIFTGNVIIGVAELKSKTVHWSEIEKKLTNGSEFALQILNKAGGRGIRFEFYHLVLCKSWRPPEYKVITSRKIIVRGKKYNILPKRCGVSFRKVISI